MKPIDSLINSLERLAKIHEECMLNIANKDHPIYHTHSGALFAFLGAALMAEELKEIMDREQKI